LPTFDIIINCHSRIELCNYIYSVSFFSNDSYPERPPSSGNHWCCRTILQKKSDVPGFIGEAKSILIMVWLMVYVIELLLNLLRIQY
jgi:hypothetical protein